MKPKKWKVVELVELEFQDEIESQQFNTELDKLCETHGIKISHIDQYYHTAEATCV